ncbi:MAG: hypothetical protein AAF356_06325 [Planctomycetota bacterium]
MPTPAQPKERSTEPPCCPRCGYDQSGEPATWRTSCPLGGQCPECGHAFRWADLFNERRRDHRWYVEHAGSPRAFFRRWIPTLAHLLTPRRYWRSLGVDSRVRPLSLIVYALLMTACAHIVSVFVIWFYGAYLSDGWGHPWYRNSAPSVNAGANWLDPITVLVREPGRLIELVSLRVLSQDFFGRWRFSIDDLHPRLLVPAAASFFAWPAMLWLLPVTRRLARLSFRHLLRATVAGFAMILVFVCASRLVLVAIHELPVVVDGHGRVLVVLASVPLFAWWSALWWSAAINEGWRIDHGHTIVRLFAVASVLAGLIAFTLGVPFETF